MNPLDLVPAPYRAVAEVIVLAVIAAALMATGWEVNGWRLENKIEQIKTADAQAAEKATAKALEDQKKLYDERDRKQSALLADAQDQLSKLKGAKDEVERLRDCVARGTCGLRVRAVCPDAGNHLPTPAQGGVVDSGTAARLDPAAEPAYFSLRLGLAVTQRTLAACQKALRTLTGQ